MRTLRPLTNEEKSCPETDLRQPKDLCDMHQLFDDYELAEVLNNYKVYGISNEQHKILNNFYDVLDRYSNEKMSWLQSVDPRKILEDPRWQQIQKMAKEVLKAFNYQKSKL